MGDSIVKEKSKAFAIRIVKLYQYLVDHKKEYHISKQLLRSGTSIGANVREANNAISKAEFVAKMSISLKEASETEYWLELLYETKYLNEVEFNSVIEDCIVLIKLLTAIIKTSRRYENRFVRQSTATTTKTKTTTKTAATKTTAKATAKTVAKATTKTTAKTKPKTATKATAKTTAKTTPKTAAKPATKTTAKTKPKTAAKATTKTTAKATAKTQNKSAKKKTTSASKAKSKK